MTRKKFRKDKQKRREESAKRTTLIGTRRRGRRNS
jgi:hypothetical protein